MRQTIKRLLPTPLKALAKRGLDFVAWDPWKLSSWAQEGEDRILQRIFERRRQGFYVDIGAHHPQRFSNTYLFYRQGWRGINIDAQPGSMAPFYKLRSRDINLEIGVAPEAGELDYYSFREPALNGFSAELSRQRQDGNQELLEVIKVRTSPLKDIFDRFLPAGQAIDFMSVDVEGFDLMVLESNDWRRYRPAYVLVEVLSKNLEELAGDAVYRFMKAQDYAAHAKSDNTVFFRDNKLPN